MTEVEQKASIEAAKSNCSTSLESRKAEYDFLKRKFIDCVIVFVSITMGVMYIGAIVFVYAVQDTDNFLLVKLFFGQFPFAVGLPGAAALAFFVIWSFEASYGEMEFALGGGVSFKGSAAPALFWVITFSAIASMINLNVLP